MIPFDSSGSALAIQQGILARNKDLEKRLPE